MVKERFFSSITISGKIWSCMTILSLLSFLICQNLPKTRKVNDRCSESESSVPCELKNHLKIDFHDWMTIRILLCYLLTSDSNVASVWRSV